MHLGSNWLVSSCMFWGVAPAGKAEAARSQQKVDSLQKLARGLSAEHKVRLRCKLSLGGQQP